MIADEEDVHFQRNCGNLKVIVTYNFLPSYSGSLKQSGRGGPRLMPLYPLNTPFLSSQPFISPPDNHRYDIKPNNPQNY